MDKQKKFEKIFKEHLKIETYSKSIDSLYSPRSLNKIDYSPYYQRNYVWDNGKATYFIESILLGTEIPPLIFFNNNAGIEVIDGRQRFETILRFMQNKFSLTIRGLNALKQLKGTNWEKLAKEEPEIIENFLDAKLRIIEFKLVNEPPLDKYLEDQVKKEIFSRYNSGITPLRKSEIENAIYDDDKLTNSFKAFLEANPVLKSEIYQTFFKPVKKDLGDPPIEKILTFIRRFLVLPSFPINYFARGTNRTDILHKLYEYYSDENIDNHHYIIRSFEKKSNFIIRVKKYCIENSLKHHRLAFECFLWGLGVLDLEQINYILDDELKVSIANYIHKNISEYDERDFAFFNEVVARYTATAIFFQDKFKADLDIYIYADDAARKMMKEAKKSSDSFTKLSELELLRLNKPEPSRNSIDDISRMLLKRRFLIRPSYQRKEVINPKKASSIIESILLGITLPAIFIYKRKDGIHEVIDGQQRLLTILGFIGNEYVNEKGQSTLSKNHNFTLRNLRILRELDYTGFSKLNEDLQDKIYDFPLYLVEIDENQNPEFNPVDLFIRLNDKPYPIREHSFEMWNSWADIEVIQELKSLKNKLSSWFFLKQIKKDNDRDRMENEELITTLAYLAYIRKIDSTKKAIDVYQKTDRINARIGSKSRISQLMQNLTENDITKREFLLAIKEVKRFAKKLKYVLLDQDKRKDELATYLTQQLDLIFKAGKEKKYFKRTRQDFYFLWLFLSELNFEMVRHHRIIMKKEIAEGFKLIKSIPEEEWEDNAGYNSFRNYIKKFLLKYAQDKRKIKLNEDQKLEMIRQQGNKSSLSNAPIFLGDDIDVDHVEPIGIGGKDKIENLGIAHDLENKSKGVKI